MNEDVKGSYFNQVVRDALHELKNNRQAFCFSKDQLNEIAKKFDVLEYKLVDGIYYISVPKEGKNGKSNNIQR